MKLHDHGVYLVNGQLTDTAPAHVTEAEARKGTIAYGIPVSYTHLTLPTIAKV